MLGVFVWKAMATLTADCVLVKIDRLVPLGQGLDHCLALRHYL